MKSMTEYIIKNEWIKYEDDADTQLHIILPEKIAEETGFYGSVYEIKLSKRRGIILIPTEDSESKLKDEDGRFTYKTISCFGHGKYFIHNEYLSQLGYETLTNFRVSVRMPIEGAGQLSIKPEDDE